MFRIGQSLDLALEGGFERDAFSSLQFVSYPPLKYAPAALEAKAWGNAQDRLMEGGYSGRQGHELATEA